ncbi:uroporphyrinogen decarboxylase family protein [Alkalibacter mobilis]|uniref:uroporphyrinogen decarboxylase family protein n=1 Tax=Alkalibacter mobilis TaxID=2787712 RepID=UPI00189E3967|nr:uroporphyrinogen decarboxylase family protein [Alkalibacter mobilis]MBF7096837.1 uroporphyrinogen decarboxylase [Alkalibacter mobilis]
MLTKRQNFLETIRGGNPDRFVKQFEAFMCVNTRHGMISPDPISARSARAEEGKPDVVNSWGVTVSWPEGAPGAFPVHDEAHKVITDITKWRDVVKVPETEYTSEEWEKYAEIVNEIDRNEVFATFFFAPGIFEQLHYLMGVDDCLINFYEEPEEMHALIKVIKDYELRYAKGVCEYLKPDCLFHHDDWGSMTSTFMSPDMFEEFFLEPYKEVYGYYKEHGVELIVHHSDSYAATLVPYMIEMGIDVFQGCSSTNKVSELIKEYGGKISFMGDIDNGVVDIVNWTPELVEREVRRACETNGKHYFIPCITQGIPGAVYPGVYDEINKVIDKLNKEMF